MWAIRSDRGKKGIRKVSCKERIRDQRSTKEREVTRSEPFGIFSRLASGNSLRELSETIRFASVCDDAVFTHRVSAGMSYKTRPNEDDGFGEIIPLCREYTLSRVNPQSRAFAAISGGTIIGPVIEVHIVTWNRYSISKQTKTDILCYIPNAELSRRLAQGNLLRPLLQVVLPGHRMRTPSASLPAERLCSHKEPFLRPRGIGKLFLSFLRMEELCQQRSQSDAAVHWGTTRTVLLKASENHGARDFPDQQWLQFTREGTARQDSSTVRILNIPWLTSEQFKDTRVEFQ